MIGRKLSRLLIFLIALIILNIVCYSSYRAILITTIGREDIYFENIPLLKGLIPRHMLEVTHDQPRFCDGDSFKILICVKSSLKNYHRRKLIRATWGSQFSKALMDARIIFFVGKSVSDPDQKQQLALEDESRTFQDVVQGNFFDTYRNITLKTVFSLSWAHNNCANAEFIMSADDDTFINPMNMQKLTKSLDKPKKFLMGIKVEKAKPYRVSRSKWYVSYEDFKGDFFPTYLTGSGYIMSSDILKDIHMCTLKTPFFSMDDIFITGMCADKIGVIPKNNKLFTQQYHLNYGCFLKNIITKADMPEDDFKRVWIEVLHRKYDTSYLCWFSEKSVLPNLIYYFLIALTIVVSLVILKYRAKIFGLGKSQAL